MSTGLKPFIGITGGIGSGKSMICRIFSILGIPVFEADQVAKTICDTDPEVKAAISDLVDKVRNTMAPSDRQSRQALVKGMFGISMDTLLQSNHIFH
jgi:dephospho-CoA kinase